MARLVVTNATRTNWLLDRVKQKPGGDLTAGDWDSELFQVPLVIDGANVGNSPWKNTRTQGMPFFIGKATNKTSARASAGGNNPPNTLGGEQWIEVRCAIQDTAGLSNVGGGAASADVCYAGQAGHWCFLIGKKQLCEGPGSDLPL